ncbi:cell division protein ZapA [Clostridium cylindrosporum]|uniref:Cell division protein ZapA n=1 Tax=Clostridium cylindrosporum DSM 605 TaxID=1121307 RepID=A0A0J8DEJ6_CLOCY|nr:cell division protein ZapA [Clostridium cylindrosporum]KMT22659.1 hypothetical protein CLCY_9c00900 [Clostridium cylindrosporum DSM 605]
MTKEKVVVKINGAEYTLRGDGSEAYLYSIASYVDRMLKDILQGNPMHSNTSAAVLTALTIADELFIAKQKLHDLEKEINIPREREVQIKANYDKLKEAYECLSKEYEQYKNESSDSSLNLKGLEDTNSKLSHELEIKIKESKRLEEELNKVKLNLKESDEINKVLIKKNESIKTQAMEALIEATTLKKEIKEFKEARINSKTV